MTFDTLEKNLTGFEGLKIANRQCQTRKNKIKKKKKNFSNFN